MFRQYRRGLPPRNGLAAAEPRPLPTSAPRRRQAKRIAEIDRYSSHTGVALAASTLLAAYRLAEQGYPADQCDIFEDRLESDAHLRSLYERRVDAVACSPWTVSEGGDTDEDKAAAKQLEDALRLVPNWTETLSHQLKSNFYGFSGSEIDWRRMDGLVVPAWLENTPHRRFHFDDTDRPKLITNLSDTEGVELQPGKWWFSSRQGRIAAATGLLRTAMWWSHFKTMSMRDWLVFAGRFGIPYVAGKYNALETSPEEKDKLEQAVAEIGSDGYATFSDACEMVIHEAKAVGEQQVHGLLVALCDSQNSKLIAGATLTSESGGTGSWALGKVHQGEWFQILNGDAMRLSKSFESAVGAPFVAYNGLKAKPPRLKIHLDLNLSVSERLNNASTAANELGLEIDEDQIRELTQLRRPNGNALRGTKGGQSRPEGESDEAE